MERKERVEGKCPGEAVLHGKDDVDVSFLEQSLRNGSAVRVLSVALDEGPFVKVNNDGSSQSRLHREHVETIFHQWSRA
jgi:hypothetical protein